jgi:GH24 family phage-related lysozyme (muramidase)
MSNHTNLKQMLVENEGRIAHMYLDTVGRVTLAVGHMIPTLAEAQKLPLRLRSSGEAATAEQIGTDFNNVQAQTPGMKAVQYLPFTALEMADADIDHLLDLDIAKTEAGVRQHFAGYDTYPEPSQDALLDMALNLGVNGLVSKFPKLKASAEAGDWNTCAAECRRLGISDDRNRKTRDLFLRAANG